MPFSAFVGPLYGARRVLHPRRRRGRAGGDFVTSPEVGPLFGALVARALDRWWRELGEPGPVRRGRGRRRARPAGRRGAARRARVRAARCGTCWSSGRRRCGPSSGSASPSSRASTRSGRSRPVADGDPAAGRRQRARSSPRSTSSRARRSTAWSSRTSCSTTSRSTWSSGPTTGWAEIRVGRRRTTRFVEVPVAASEESRVARRSTRRSGPGSRCSAGRELARRVRDGAAPRRGAARRLRGRGRRARGARSGRVAAHVPRPRARRRPARRPGRAGHHHRRAAPETLHRAARRAGFTRRDRDRPRPSGSRALGIDELVDEGRRDVGRRRPRRRPRGPRRPQPGHRGRRAHRPRRPRRPHRHRPHQGPADAGRTSGTG